MRHLSAGPRPSRSLRALVLIVVVLGTTGFLNDWSSSAPTLARGWDAHDENNGADIDHGAWADLLSRYLQAGEDGINRFAYARVSAADRALLEDYLGRMARVQVTAHARDVQLAYWLNLYNALTVKVILDHYPVRSIKDIDTSGLFTDGPWGQQLITVQGATLTLDNIEHNILRPIWRDPRIHYAVNCASIGCPNLQAVPYTAGTVDSMMTAAARAYVNHPRGVRIDGNRVTVSKIYSWFAHDFGNSEAGVLTHLLTYAEPALAERLRAIGTIHATEYDWSLNE